MTSDVKYQKVVDRVQSDNLRAWIERSIGGWKVGQWYKGDYGNQKYLVLAIYDNVGVHGQRDSWCITVATAEELRTGRARTHSTAWDMYPNRELSPDEVPQVTPERMLAEHFGLK